jgi:hypothetical protein
VLAQRHLQIIRRRNETRPKLAAFRLFKHAEQSKR